MRTALIRNAQPPHAKGGWFDLINMSLGGDSRNSQPGHGIEHPMTLQLKTITAFLLSFAVTLVLAVAAYHETRLIEDTQARLELAAYQLRDMDQSKLVLKSHQQAVSDFLLTEDESCLDSARSAIEQALSIIETRIESNGQKLRTSMDHIVDEREVKIDQDHLRLFVEIVTRLAAADRVVASIVAIEQSGREEEAESRYMDE